MIGFRMPTRVHIAPGCLAQLPTAASSLGLRDVLLVVDPGLAVTEWPEAARLLLAEAGIRCTIFDRVEPNPRTTTAELAAATLREERLDGVIAVGGGSVLDAAKAAAMLATNPGLAVHYEGKNRFAHQPLPLVAIPTTCGTGSEVTWVAVLTHEPTRSKLSVKGDGMFPNQALVDAELIATLPPQLIAWTGVDALTHALEATTCKQANPVSDALAEKAIALLFTYLPRAVADIAGDHLARVEVMRAATLAGLAFGNADVAGVHCLSETLGGLYDVPHGLANAILLLPVLRYHQPVIAPRLAELDVRLFSGQRDSADGAEHLLAELAEWLRQLAIPSFSSLGIPADQIPEIAERATRNGSNNSNPQPMTAKNYREILHELMDSPASSAEQGAPVS